MSNQTAGLIILSTWSAPGGADTAHYYTDAPFDPATYGIQACFDQHYPGTLGAYKATIDPPQTNFNLTRRSLYSNDSTSLDTHRAQVDLVAAASSNGVHQWLSEFTHRVGTPYDYGGSMCFYDFRAYMEYLADTYGQAGSDRMWFAGPQTVNEYLKTREACRVESQQEQEVLTIRIDRSQVPAVFSRKALSLMVQADQPIRAISVSGDVRHTENIDTGLINIDWSTTCSDTSEPLLLSNLFITPTGHSLSWPASSGQVYTIYWSTSLTNEFQPLGPPVNGSSFLDSAHPNQQTGFYKLVAQVAL